MRLRAKSKSKSTSTSTSLSSPSPLSAAAASTSLSSAAVASPSQGPGGEGGGNRSESPETTSILPAAATASSTRKTRTKQGESNTDTTNGPAAIDEPQNTAHVPTVDLGDDNNLSKKAGVKTMWVTIFKCFTCGKRGHDLTKCARCEEAYYCDRDCQIAHARAHAKVCVATVAAKAQRAHRERIARALRKNGEGKVGGGEMEDNLCVICQSKPVNEVEVSQSCVCVRARTRARVCVCV